jgi:Domain of unknown function (DUF1996)
MRMKIGRSRCVVSSMRLMPYAAALAVLLVFVADTPASLPKLHGNNFYANCRFSHTNMDDPIVYPGEPGKSHHHTFFGNASTDASSTLASLRRAKTTCKPAADKAAYWVPTLYVGTREIRPPKAQFYFNLRGYDQMHPFPAGLEVVAGDAHATRPQSTNVVYWACASSEMFRSAPLLRPPRSCADVPVKPKKGFFRACATCPLVPLRSRRPTTPLHLELHVNFPDCWDGKHLDSPDHHSHMAYSRNYVCPPSHPVKVPLIRLNVRYSLTGGLGVHLASGGVLTGHADFLNAWNEAFLKKLVDTCFHDRPCDPKAMSR